MGRWVKQHALGVVLFALFFLSLVGQWIAQWRAFQLEQIAHGEQPRVADYAWSFAASVLENWQSEYLQLVSFVVLATYLIYRGSPQSKDGDERRDAQLQRIEWNTRRCMRPEDVERP